MSSAGKDFILEDINSGERFILKHDEPGVSCGRGKQNQILSQSILASREHCIFVRRRNGVCVIDQGSANGVYINGVRKEAEYVAELHVNDLIGLGCTDVVPDSTRDPKCRTIFRLLAMEEAPPVEVEQPSEPSTQDVGDVTARTSTINKRRQSNSSLEYKVPSKIPKLEVQDPDIIDISDESEDENSVPKEAHKSCNDKEVDEKPNVSSTKVKAPETASTSSSKEVSRCLENNDTELSFVAGTSTGLASHGSKRVNDNVKSFQNPPNAEEPRNSCNSIHTKSKFEDIDKNHCQKSSKTSKVGDLRLPATVKKTNSATKPTDSRTEHIQTENMKLKKEFSAKISSNKSDSGKQSLKSAKSKEGIVPSPSNRRNSSGSSEETRRASTTNGRTGDGNLRSDEESVDFLVPAFDINELVADEPTASKDHRRKFDEPRTPNKPINRTNSVRTEQQFKYEPELNIVDEDASSRRYNGEADRTNFVTPTPIKLKHVKREPPTRYSTALDVIILSDDEDGVFVASQLFGDNVDGGTEPKVELKDEEYDENYREYLEDREHEFHEPILVSDSDEEEDNPFLDRIIRSQLLNESRRSFNESDHEVEAENVDLDIEKPVQEAGHMEVDELSGAEEEGELFEENDLFDEDVEEPSSIDLPEEIYDICFADDNEEITKDISSRPKRKDGNNRAIRTRREKKTEETIDEGLCENQSRNDHRMTEKTSENEKPIGDKHYKKRVLTEGELIAVEEKNLTEEKKRSKKDQLLEEKKTFTERKLSADKETLEEKHLSVANKSREGKKLCYDERSVEESRLYTAKKPIKDKRLSIDDISLEERRLSAIKISTEAKKISANEKTLENKSLSTARNSIEAKRLSADEESNEEGRSFTAKKSTEDRRLSTARKPTEEKRLSDVEKSAGDRCLSAVKKSNEKKELSAVKKTTEKKILSVDKQLPEKKRLSADERLPEKKILSTDKQLPEKTILSADERLPEKKRLSADDRLTEKKRLSAGERLTDKKLLSTDKQSLGKKRLSADNRLPEKKRLSADNRLPEKKRFSADKRLPAEKIPADKILPEAKSVSVDKRSSIDKPSVDKILPETKSASVEKRSSIDKPSVDKILPEAKRASVDKRSSIDKPSLVKEKSVAEDTVDEGIVAKSTKHETKSRHDAEKRRRSNEPKLASMSDSSNDKLDFVEPKSKDSAPTVDLQRDLRRNPLVVLTKVDSVRKCVQLVEPPFLAKGEHRGVSCSIKTADKSFDKQDAPGASTSGTNDREKEPTRKLTTKEKKELALKTKIEKKMQLKEQRYRRIKNKWAAECIPEKKNPAHSPFNREERKDIVQERRERLKQISLDEKLAKEERQKSPVKRIVVKPRAKVTMNTRNDFLVKELEEQAKLTSANAQRLITANTDKSAEATKEKDKSVELGPDIVAHSERTISENKDKDPRIMKHQNTSKDSVTEAPTDFERIIPENGVKSSEISKQRDTPMELGSEDFTNAEPSPQYEEKSSRKEITKRKDVSRDTDVVKTHRVHKHATAKDKDKSPEQANRVIVNGESHQRLDMNSVKSVPKKTKSSMILLEQSELPNMLPEKMSTRASKKTTVTTTATVTAPTDWAHGFGKHSERIGQNLTNGTSTDVPLKFLQDPRVRIGQSGKSLLKENREPTETKQFGESKPPKRVSFDDLRTRVNLFEIDPGNNLNKCVAKDAPLLVKKLPRCSTVDPKASCPKLEQFLLHIFKWNPAWLSEQALLSTPPPIVDEKKLVPLLSKYTTYEDYYNVAEPLLALELWYGITRDFESNMASEKACFNYSIVNNSLTLTTVPLTKFRVTTLMLEIVVSRRDAKIHAHPVYGDLVFFEYISKKKGRSSLTEVFAYITDVRSTVITPMKHLNRDLLNFVKDPHILLTCTVMTKPLDVNDILTNKVNRLRTISYLRSNIRMIQALQNLPVSPLSNTILRPTIEEYQLPPVGHADDYPLVTKDKLNPKQLEAVIKVTNTVVQRLPKVCLIHGPPGTGKSRVIVNLVTQILHVNALCYKNKTLKILVCAPSNAAIDEIVLRLLEIRKSFEKKNRFNMVRIGRTERMHPHVKPVSVTELAVQDVKKTTSTYSSPNCDSDSVEEEKRFLQARINALKLEESNTRTRCNPMYQKQVKRKLEDIQAKYNLLKHRQPANEMDSSELSKLQRAAENGLLKGADVIACTLRSCYTNQMEAIFGGKDSLSVCIVDEATQSAEAETLIPLMLGVKTLVLVGDTNQLPATVLSQKAKQFGLDQSLFARIQNAFDGQKNNPVIFLDTQYRMSSPVSWWPNRYFYGGALKNGLDNHPFPLHGYKILNLDSTQDEEDKLSNTAEAAFVASVVYTLMTRSKLDKMKNPVKIGVITPYNNQKQLVTQKIRERISHVPVKIKDQISHEVNTVDGFQGQERDIILMSCVRSSGIGFLSDPQRLCVALTRAKHSLILCGNFKTFEKDAMWRALLSDARERKVYVNIRSDASANEIMKHIVR